MWGGRVPLLKHAEKEKKVGSLNPNLSNLEAVVPVSRSRAVAHGHLASESHWTGHDEPTRKKAEARVPGGWDRRVTGNTWEGTCPQKESTPARCAGGDTPLVWLGPPAVRFCPFLGGRVPLLK